MLAGRSEFGIDNRFEAITAAAVLPRLMYLVFLVHGQTDHFLLWSPGLEATTVLGRKFCS